MLFDRFGLCVRAWVVHVTWACVCRVSGMASGEDKKDDCEIKVFLISFSHSCSPFCNILNFFVLTFKPSLCLVTLFCGTVTTRELESLLPVCCGRLYNLHIMLLLMLLHVFNFFFPWA